MRKEVTTFLRALLSTERCNWKYINLFLMGGWTTTSRRIYHQAFSAIIPGCTGCKFGVFLNNSVRGTHVIQPSNQTFECMGDIAHYQLYPKKKKTHQVPLSPRAVLSTSLLVVLQFSFFTSPQAKYDFWPLHPCGQRSKV